MKNWRKKLISLVLTLVMVVGMIPLTVAPAVAETSTSWTKLGGSTGGQTIGTSGQTKYYYITANITCSNSNAGGSGLTIAGGATVYIYIPANVTLTCTGKAASGRTGGGAGILLPSDSNLYLIGSGKVIATGGNASKGANGENGISSYYNNNWDAISTSGAGGNGGGGAGAGIGTAGGTGGTGGSRQSRTQHIPDDYEDNGWVGNNGTAGSSAENAGNLYVSGVDISDVKGGQAAANNTVAVSYSGTAKQNWNNQIYYIGGAGGGGNGGSGCAANNIGPGGAGGGGGGSGGTGGMMWSWNYTGNYYYVYGGHGGKGGNTYSSSNNNLFEAGKEGKKDYKGDAYKSGGKGGNGYGAGAPKSAKSAITTNNPTFNIKYNNLDGTTSYSTYEVDSDSRITLNDCPGCKWRIDKCGSSCGNNSTLCSATDELFNGNATIDAINVYGDLEFTAIPQDFTVTLNANGGTGGTEIVTATYNSAMPTATMPTRTGYTFNGYYDAASDGNQYYNADGTSAKNWDKASDTTLYAQWTPNTYTITLNKDGGKCDSLTSYTYGVGATLPTPTRDKYVFSGWFEDEKFTGSPVEAISSTDYGDKTFFARWLTVTDWHLESGKCDVGGLMGHQYNKENGTIGRTIIGLTDDMLAKIGDKLVIVGGDSGKQTTLSIDCAYTYFYNQTEDGKYEMITAKEMGVAAFVIIEYDGNYNDISGYGYYRLYSDSANSEDNFLFDVMYKGPSKN